MKIERKHLLGVAVACVFASGILSLVSNLHAETTIDFVVPDGTSIATGAAGDIIVFVGRSTTTSSVDSCGAAGDYPVQTGIAVDPGGNRAARITGIINTTSTTAVANGTRLANIALINQCAISGANYTKYRGEVQ